MKAEKRFIIGCLRAYIGCGGGLKHLFNKVNLKKLENIMGDHELEGFFYYLYINDYLSDLDFPESMIISWKKVAGKNSLVNAANDREAVSLARSFEDNGIGYIHMKGLSTRNRCYNVDYIRSSSDIDLFIKRNDYGRAKAVLTDMGYDIPFDSYIRDYDVRMPQEEYEKRAYGIMFLKKQGKFRYGVDLQWDFVLSEKNSVFHSLYRIDKFYKVDDAVDLKVGDQSIKVFSLESAFINLVFHFAFIHGFIGAKFFLDICEFLRRNYENMNLALIHKKATVHLRKIVGLVLMLCNDCGCGGVLDREQRKLFCVGRLLPLEYRFYRSMVLRASSKLNRIILRFVRILLPCSIIGRLRVANYQFFNTDSISQRLQPDAGIKRYFLPFSLLGMLFRDILRRNKSQ